MSRAGTVAIDVGGTFTDITFADAATGATWAAKTPSTPGDLSGGFITAVRKVLALAGRAPGDILHVFHGTTTATNAILEGKTPPTAVVTMASALNAAVMPPVSRYVSVLRDALDAEGVRAPLLIMKSDGGVTSAATCVRQPVQTVLSGPAAGVIGALSVAGTAGHRDIISIDVGGTSADICLVREGRPEITKEGMIGPFPLKLPMIDIHTIGAAPIPAASPSWPSGAPARCTRAGSPSCSRSRP